MASSAALLLCLLAMCSVWTVRGRSLEIGSDEEEQVDMEISAKIPGICWACKWSLNKVKKLVGPNATAESLKSKLKSICNEIGLLKAACNKFVKTHLGELIEELMTTDDVRTICVNTGACKPKELLDIYPGDEESYVKIELSGKLMHG
ncbi:antimicrobial peptide NK-lysin-like [Embiotoca jacksoni]|uniref:antimicrobial peptide NK-lysin-like n=1 Tax=Embiotoca jacksoni TaxID=100190 RepID=UPI003703960D